VKTGAIHMMRICSHSTTGLRAGIAMET
jgi:hypothetical protein